MGRPKNKADRILRGNRKARKRTWWYYDEKTLESDQARSGPLRGRVTQRDIDRCRGMHRDMTKGCSCPACCGNPRRSGKNKRTRQERINEMKGREETE